jgi:hypothetical protein
MSIKVKKICYFIELNDGTTRKISEKEYNRKKEYYYSGIHSKRNLLNGRRLNRRK